MGTPSPPTGPWELNQRGEYYPGERLPNCQKEHPIVAENRFRIVSMSVSAISNRAGGSRPERRVLVVCNDAQYFLRHRLAVVTHLVSLGIGVTVITGGEVISANLIKGWDYIHVPIKRFAFDLIGDIALMLRTSRVVWSVNPEVVHLITLKPTVFSGLASFMSRLFQGSPKRILITLPGLGRMLAPSNRPGERRYPIASVLTRMAIRFMAQRDYVFFTFESEHDYAYWVKQGVATDKNSSIIDGAGVDPSAFYPSTSTRQDSKMKVLFASRLTRAKGLDAYLMTARALANRSDVEFLVAGIADSQDPDAIPPEYLQQLKEISFLGEVTDMPRLLRECDIVCLPTRYGEGIPRILIEAAATGLASIASGLEGCRELVVDGATGRIIYGESDAEMARQMSDVVLGYLENPDRLEQHKRAAYQLFLSKNFAQDAVVAKFAELLGM
jgi:glycosyltransferase involved in cell wall biosynthesis